jgi:hypothetical protein
MHFLRHLLSYMAPPFGFIFGGEEPLPPGFDRVITSRGGFVVTSRNAYVIAKG